MYVRRFGLPILSVRRASSALPSPAINTAKYPIGDRSSSSYRDLVGHAQHTLKTTGCMSLEGFLTQEATAVSASNASQVVPHAFEADFLENVYQYFSDDPSLPANHVRNLKLRTNALVVAYDQIPATDPLRLTYECDHFLNFVADVTGKSLHRLADPLGACYINVLPPGYRQAWHFDENEYATSICVQASDSGGQFMYTPALRDSTKDLATQPIAQLLSRHSDHEEVVGGVEGDPCPPVHTAPYVPGTLQIFKGDASLHRVSPVGDGSKFRMSCICNFSSESGAKHTKELQKQYWGRTSEEAMLGN